jgi:hypothetical protein
MQSTTRIAATLGACLSLAGCIVVPVSVTSMEPSAVSGQIERLGAPCPVPVEIRFAAPNLDWIYTELWVALPNQTSSGKLELNLWFRKEPRITSFFRTDADREEYGSKMRHHVEIDPAAATIALSWENDGKATVPVFPKFLNGESSLLLTVWRYERNFEVPEFSGDWLDVDLPAIAFDGVARDFPRIRFTRVSRTAIESIRCWKLGPGQI